MSVINLSEMGSTIADSWYLYKWLDKRLFDIVLIHHAIHEYRLNFQVRSTNEEFDNISWFRRKRDVDMWYTTWTKTPLMLAYRYTSFLEKKGTCYTGWSYWKRDDVIDWRNVKSNICLPGYTNYIKRFIECAHRRKEQIFFINLAYASNENHDTARANHSRPLLEEYNDTLESVVKRSGAGFIDVSEMTGHSVYFKDGLHMSEKGIECFVKNIVDEMPKNFRR